MVAISFSVISWSAMDKVNSLWIGKSVGTLLMAWEVVNWTRGGIILFGCLPIKRENNAQDYNFSAGLIGVMWAVGVSSFFW